MALPLLGLLPMLGDLAGKAFDRLFPDKEQAEKAKAEFNAHLIANAHELEKSAAEIVRAEAASSHWLAANWRPITMLIFVGLIVARWFGFAAPNLTEAEYLKLWGIVEIGLGGYIVGRSAEKVLPAIADAIKRR